MGKVTSIYIRDDKEFAMLKVALAAFRGKESGLSVGEIRKAVEVGLGNVNVAEVVDDKISGQQVDGRGWLIIPRNDNPPPNSFWVTKIDRLWHAGLPQEICEKLNDIPHVDVEAELKNYGYAYENDTLYDTLYNSADKKPSALPSNTEREVPFQLKRFVSEGWDLETAFRIYDEWDADMHNITEHSDNVKSLNQRFMEERMKRDADESAE